ncbi:MerR family transcriptional regulator [Arachnia propionica]|jgi:transcriptional regulator, merR family|uniref:HTH-type transcriptional activator tipA n=1 Tax=Arachnia propionica TaxID=1750 RepID=A0A3N4CVE8_9ACTN|nr:MerR family transcriptional regulator [Arachnia propionica]AFN46152.1 transcriptional regulator, MerR family [Arachnia propionica F0230a]QCT37383.1 MerR family transcriptional regulator [Arachnia propionica]QUC10268.1 MerR family transcriptional regulator [Arachnia propionica]RPA17171.1 MerR family transcriptional regulator [Arachnia propionica]VEH69692.1 HTH-type transcriptional activator tipA [Arachnia propionica]
MSINNDLSNEMSPGAPPNRSGEQAALTGLTWSTQAISDLVGITVRTLRYYHQIGLLREPKRTTKGLLYDETHLLTLLRIKRFSMMSLTLDEIADIIHTPTSPRARRILLELDQALADRVAEIESQRRVIEECLRDNTPVDVLPRFARHLAALRRLGNYDTTAADKALEELAAGYGSEEVARVVDAVIQDPIISRLSVLEERLRRINEDSGEPELTDLAKDYGRLLVDLYTVNAQAGLKSVSGHDLVEAIGLAESTANEREREVLKRALTVLAAHVDGAG